MCTVRWLTVPSLLPAIGPVEFDPIKRVRTDFCAFSKDSLNCFARWSIAGYVAWSLVFTTAQNEVDIKPIINHCIYVK